MDKCYFSVDMAKEVIGYYNDGLMENKPGSRCNYENACREILRLNDENDKLRSEHDEYKARWERSYSA